MAAALSSAPTVMFCSFEKSATQKFEVPRMLFDEPQQLESYILKSKDQ